MPGSIVTAFLPPKYRLRAVFLSTSDESRASATHTERISIGFSLNSFDSLNLISRPPVDTLTTCLMELLAKSRLSGRSFFPTGSMAVAHVPAHLPSAACAIMARSNSMTDT